MMKKEKKEIDFFIGKKRNFILQLPILSILIGTMFYFEYHKKTPLIFWVLVFFYPISIFRTVKLLTSKEIFFVSKEELKDSDNIAAKDKHDKYVP